MSIVEVPVIKGTLLCEVKVITARMCKSSVKGV